MEKNWFLFLVFGLVVIFLAACEEDPKLTVLEPVAFTATPTASAAKLILTEETQDENVLSLAWQEVSYPVDAPVTYTIQITTPADTIGASPWANALEKEVGDDVTSVSMTGEELNAVLLEMGLEPEVETTIVARIMAYLDRAAYSKALSLQVTPFEIFTGYPTLWVAGDFQGWNIGAATTLASRDDNGIYEGYIYIPAGGTNEFKVYAQPNWEPTSYGDGGDGKVIVANYAGANFKAPSEGYYLFSVDLNTMSYILIKTSWSLIGGATPGGWDSDTPMSFNPTQQVWTVTTDMKSAGSFKFRANNAWQLDFGLDDEGNLAYANHPWKTYIDRPQLTVPNDGNYTITLDLKDPGNYKYTIKKN